MNHAERHQLFVTSFRAHARPRLCTPVSCAMFLTIDPFIPHHGNFVSVYIYADVVCVKQDAAFVVFRQFYLVHCLGIQ